MLNIDVNVKTRDFRVMAAGDLGDIVNDLAHAINILYSKMKHSAHPESAKAFRMAMVALCTDPNSPMFDGQPVHGDGITIVTNGKEG